MVGINRRSAGHGLDVAVNIFPRPVAFRVPNSDFEIVVLDPSGHSGPSGVVLDPKSTSAPVTWGPWWDATRRGMRGSGLSLRVRKAVSLVAGARRSGDRLLLDLSSASMRFELELLLEPELTRVTVRRVPALPRPRRSRKKPRLRNPPLPLLVAESRASGSSSRVLREQYSAAGARVRCVPLKRAVGLLLSAREVAASEVRALSK